MFLHDVEGGTALFTPHSLGDGCWTVAVRFSCGRRFTLDAKMEAVNACMLAARLTETESRSKPECLDRVDWIEVGQCSKE
jgi:hypothetical protein